MNYLYNFRATGVDEFGVSVSVERFLLTAAQANNLFREYSAKSYEVTIEKQEPSSYKLASSSGQDFFFKTYDEAHKAAQVEKKKGYNVTISPSYGTSIESAKKALESVKKLREELQAFKKQQDEVFQAADNVIPFKRPERRRELDPKTADDIFQEAIEKNKQIKQKLIAERNKSNKNITKGLDKK